MKIQTIENYILKVNELVEKWDLSRATTHTWFRGQNNHTWPLFPKLLRDGNVDSSFEREYHRDFKLLANNYLSKQPSDDFEWMFIMQHYGMPTRLLDWSESHLIGLFFAVENYHDKEDAAVWVLDPWSMNEATFGEYSVPIHSHSFLKDYILPSPTDGKRAVEGFYPICLRPPKTTNRILAQKGCFTIHGNVRVAIEDLAQFFNKSKNQESKIRIKKLTIDGNSKLRILKQLMIAGITHSVIFPDLDGLSKEIELRYSKDYLTNSVKFAYTKR